VVIDLPSLEEIKQRVHQEVAGMRNDYMRLLNPTPYKVYPPKKCKPLILQIQVSVTDDLYNFVHELWLKEAPIPDLSNDEKTEKLS